MSFELVPYTEIKALLELAKASLADYPDLEVINNRLLDSFEEFLGRGLEKISRTEIVFTHGTKTRMVSLIGLPIDTIESVTTTSEGVTSTVDSSLYEETNYGIRLAYPVSNTKITVTYTGGLTTVTGKIKAAALYQLAYEFQSKEQIGATSFSSEGGTVNRPQLGLLKETQRMLKGSIHPLKLD